MSYGETELSLPALARIAGSYPMLEEAEERELGRRVKELHDIQARNKLVESHLRIVVAAAARYGKSFRQPPVEFYQVGAIGLMEAADRFNPDMNNRFSTYAKWWIRAAMMNYALRNASVVRVGDSEKQKRLFLGIGKEQQSFERLGLSKAEVDQALAEKFGVSLEDVYRVRLARLGGDKSLNSPISTGEQEDTREHIDMLIDERMTPDEELEERDFNSKQLGLLHIAIQKLSDRQRAIFIARRLPPEGEKPKSLEELGAEFGISKERVRQLEVRAFECIQAFMLGDRDTYNDQGLKKRGHAKRTACA